MTNPFALDNPAPAPAAAPVTTTVTTDLRQAPAPAAVPATANAADDPFDNPAAQTAKGPRLRDMYGRLLIVIPRKLETGVVSRNLPADPVTGQPKTQDRLTADVIVLDGGTIHYGGKPEEQPPVAHDKAAEVPVKFSGMYISAVGLISQCREALAKTVSQGRPGMVIGRLLRGQDSGKGNPPWLLQPATPEDRAIGKAYLATVDPFAS
jgi:hypothetical protein